MLQIVEGFPNTSNYGEFLSSMTSSFLFRRRSPENAGRVISKFLPGEIIRGHLFFNPANAADLKRNNTVNYFIYRDPRDVVVSEAHYLRSMNRSHRLAPYFRELSSIEAAIELSITGFKPGRNKLDFPNIAERFARYEGWLHCDDCLPIRFEDLVSENRDSIIRQIADFYIRRCTDNCDVAVLIDRMRARIAPEKSHTYRSGKKSGWEKEFTASHCRLFARVAGDLLVRLGYESNVSWADARQRSSEGRRLENL